MPQYTVTYIKEVTQVIEASNTDSAGEKAQRFANDHKLRLLSVYRNDPNDPVAHSALGLGPATQKLRVPG
jgi:hypothetical protein